LTRLVVWILVFNVVIYDPNNNAEDFNAFICDAATTIDPVTGLPVAGKRVNVSVLYSDLKDKSFEGVHGVMTKTAKPWLVRFNDVVLGRDKVYKVVQSLPSNTVGLVSLVLEEYKS
jgi:hypothetical protein